ncbi:unnamed protein product [Polarella glacialis]|uniref:Uncharacterized protein n=1 Tax=Polarella glacialis TaxID=89957 RepID=A0A813FCU4_POLGL|nr:unnamed protein product [Polarella glacialis]
MNPDSGAKRVPISLKWYRTIPTNIVYENICLGLVSWSLECCFVAAVDAKFWPSQHNGRSPPFSGISEKRSRQERLPKQALQELSGCDVERGNCKVLQPL